MAPKPSVNIGFEWSVGSVIERSLQVGVPFYSPMFAPVSEPDFKWRLELFLGGVDASTKDFVSLFIHSCSTKKYNVKTSFSILHESGIEKCKKDMKPITVETGFGFDRYMLRKDLLVPASKFVVNNCLTIYCKVKTTSGSSNNTGHQPNRPAQYNMLQLSEDFGTLVNNNHYGDVTLIVGGKQFRAYKGILAVRSSVFAAMFRHDMQEHQRNQVTIDDIDQDVFSELLYFVYTNRVPKLKQMANELLKVADRYALEDLKTLCEEELALKLTVETAVNTLVLADLHCATMLKAKAIVFINKNVSKIIKTKNWENLKKNYPHLMEEAYVALAMNEHNN